MIPHTKHIVPFAYHQEIKWYSTKEATPSNPGVYPVIDKWGDGPVEAYWDGNFWKATSKKESRLMAVRFFAEVKVPEEIEEELVEEMIEERLHDPAPENSSWWEREYQKLYGGKNENNF